MSFTFISTRIKIKYNYNIIHIDNEFIQKCKKFPILRVASVESTRISWKKVKDSPQYKNNLHFLLSYTCTMVILLAHFMQ